MVLAKVAAFDFFWAVENKEGNNNKRTSSFFMLRSLNKYAQT
jgi:hypothetical protein